MNHIKAREFAHKMMKTWRKQEDGLFRPDLWAVVLQAYNKKHPNGVTHAVHNAMEAGDLLEAQALIVAILTGEYNDSERSA